MREKKKNMRNCEENIAKEEIPQEYANEKAQWSVHRTSSSDLEKNTQPKQEVLKKSEGSRETIAATKDNKRNVVR